MAEAMTYEPIERVPVTLEQAADCGCCGAEATPTYPVFRAALYDTDGEFYRRLCGSCFDDVERDIIRSYDPESGVFDFAREHRFVAQVGAQLLGEDLDALPGLVEDFVGGSEAERRAA